MKELIHGHEYQEAGIIESYLSSFVILGHYLHVNLHLLGLKIGRKAITNLENVFKSRDISLLTKARLVKAVVLQ